MLKKIFTILKVLFTINKIHMDLNSIWYQEKDNNKDAQTNHITGGMEPVKIDTISKRDILNKLNKGPFKSKWSYHMCEPINSYLYFDIHADLWDNMHEIIRDLIRDHNTAPGSIYILNDKKNLNKIKDTRDVLDLDKLKTEDLHKYPFLKPERHATLLPIIYHPWNMHFHVCYIQGEQQNFYLFVNEFDLFIIKDHSMPKEFIEISWIKKDCYFLPME